MGTARPPTIEDIILSWNKGNMLALRPHLPSDYCMEAARFVRAHPGTALIVTGFFEIVPKVIETDGPPGAMAVGHALQAMGRRVVYVSDRHAVPFLRTLDAEAEVLEFPIASPEESEAFARGLLARLTPSVVIAVERCSVTPRGRYLNLPRQDISAFTARTDFLFPANQPSVGVGDGGNEIGMGKLAQVLPQLPGLIREPAATATTHLIIATVSNWGGYGLASALSVLEGRDLLPSSEEEANTIRRMVDMGAVDGDILKSVPGVDGFSLEQNLEILARLRDVMKASG